MPEDVEETSDQGPAFQAAQEFQRLRTDSAYFFADCDSWSVQVLGDQGRLVRLQTSPYDVSFWLSLGRRFWGLAYQ